MEMLQRWHNPCAMASGNTVIVTPVETDQLYCFDLADGVNRFSKPRVGAFYAAGIRGDRFFIVGSRTIKCFDTERRPATMDFRRHRGQLGATIRRPRRVRKGLLHRSHDQQRTA